MSAENAESLVRDFNSIDRFSAKEIKLIEIFQILRHFLLKRGGRKNIVMPIRFFNLF